MPEIVEATTSDGIRLHGAYHPAQLPAQLASPRAVDLDAVLLLHGAGGNFYGSSLFAGLLPMLRQLGLAVLAVNTRGHDAVSSAATPGGVRMLGAAFETVDECRHDLAAWIAWLVQQGHHRVALAGHSLGAVKAIYGMALEGSAAVKCLIAMSPPRLAHSQFADGPDAAQFLTEYAEAERLVGEGKGDTIMPVKFPIPYLVSAAGYVDKYGPAERYNILKHVRQVACPTLFTFGTIELRRGSAFQGLPEELNDLAEHKNDLKVAVIAGADHFYTAARGELAGQIESWLRQTNRRTN
ncbi:MAG TPA: alpha/beta fold hydrolase [Pirellulales bacterium]|nr:alpha/beta fold hydrolase [Pirellulales bacterium]